MSSVAATMNFPEWFAPGWGKAFWSLELHPGSGIGVVAGPQANSRDVFYEYFHGDNGAGLGASHQTGWTGLMAKQI
jgi:hypothetical protein